MSPADHLTSDQLCRALNLRDLTDPTQGGHAIQVLLDAVVGRLRSAWHCTVRTVRHSPIVAVRENYDRLGYDSDDVTRARRYTRYISPTVMLRSHTSAELPSALERYVGRDDVDELIVAPASCTGATPSIGAMWASRIRWTSGASAALRRPATRTCSR
ncbi:hypothetical protein [Nesterenkonia sp. PF2B19]|uniref:hypothetical protein n=1 Tax=Nesterenkonia sp. PF2B19 TaxID=1881858 RepID=UPI000A45685A